LEGILTAVEEYSPGDSRWPTFDLESGDDNVSHSDDTTDVASLGSQSPHDYYEEFEFTDEELKRYD
jgi:hypothetical protein